jgi:nucleoside-diphosphate-sugar epimerase
MKLFVALVTGATGFIGGHLVSRLVREGWQVHVVTRKGTNLPATAEFSQVTTHTHDGTTEGMIRLVGEAKPLVIFHLASLFLSQHEAKDVAPLVLSNVLFGSQLLEGMRVNGVSQIVNTGTSWQHYNHEEYNPVCLYAATKQAFEDILTYYTATTPIKAITLKLFDTYGPNDVRQKLFFLLENTARTGTPLEMSAGEQMIDLVHVTDVVQSYLIAAQRLMAGGNHGHQKYGVSSGEPMLLKEIVELYGRVIGRKLNIEWGARKYRVREVMVTCNTLPILPGWLPKIRLENGIKEIFSQFETSVS